MDIYIFIEKHFELLRTAQGWVLIAFGLACGFAIYHQMYHSALSELQLKQERLEAIASQQSLTGTELSDLQKQFLKNLVKYQKGNNLIKLVITRDGRIYDDTKGQLTNENVITNFLGKDKATFPPTDFEKLVYAIPEKYLKIIPETRLDSPYVITFMPAAVDVR